MSLNLANPPAAYDAADQAKLRAALMRADAESLKRGMDALFAEGRAILRSPDGTLWALTVSDAGVVGAEAVG